MAVKTFQLSDIPLAVRLKRQAAFAPCKTKEELLQWVRLFMGIRIPATIVSEESNCSPGDMLWEIYDRCLRNDLEGFENMMVWASRFSGKTLIASILETLVVLHMPRNVCHMAAIEPQAKKAQSYVKDWFSRPVLRDFIYGDNAREIKVVSYTNANGDVLNDKEFNKLGFSERDSFVRRERYIVIIICTMAGANSQHGEFFVTDECDVIPKQNIKAYDQARGGIPVGRDGCTAFTLLTSTRKSRVGLVQKEIDKAQQSGLILRHWNVVDVTEPCPPSRHLPDAPRQIYYINDGNVQHITQAEYDILPGPEKPKWYEKEGYAGCEKCRLFSACKGALATEQEGFVGAFQEGGTALLVRIPEIASKFKLATPEFITTEFLCRKPDTSGLVYPRLRDDLHFKRPEEIVKLVSGEDVPLSVLLSVNDKPSLIKYLQTIGVRFYTGMDFGFSHLFAVSTVAVWGKYVFVVDCIGQAGLEQDEKIAMCEHLKALPSTIYPDIADAEAILTFKRRGFRMVDWSKGGGSKAAGIEIVRSKIWTNGAGATLFFLEGDPMIQACFKEMSEYCFTTDAAGDFTNEPLKEDDDFSDSIRYVLMNVFGKKGALKAPVDPPRLTAPAPDPMVLVRQHQANWMADHVRSLTTDGTGPNEKTVVSQNVVKRGGFIWDGGE